MLKRKGRAYATEAPNLKRFREDVTALVYESALKGSVLTSAAAPTTSKKTAGGLNRKEKRKLMKREKKQRVQNFQLKKQGKEVPVVGRKGGKSGGGGKKVVDGVKTGVGEGGSVGDGENDGGEGDALDADGQIPKKKKKKKKKNQGSVESGGKKNEVDEMEEWESQARKIRIEQLLTANKEEDKNIKLLEKNLGIKKRKKKAKGGTVTGQEDEEQTSKIPNSFKLDGLDFLLELCDETTRESAVEAEKMAEEVERRRNEKRKEVGAKKSEDRDEEDGEFNDFLGLASDDEFSDGSISDGGNYDGELSGDDEDVDGSMMDEEEEVGGSERSDGLEGRDNSDGDDSDMDDEEDGSGDEVDKGDENEVEGDSDDDAELKGDEVNEGDDDVQTFEDIYGRIRDAKTKEIVKDNRGVAEPGENKKKSSLEIDTVVSSAEQPIEQKQSKYIPPSLRAAAAQQSTVSTKISRQIKGLLNRLCEANVASIATAIEEIYAATPRNLVTSTLTSLVFGACVPENQVTASKFILEYALLVGVLHQSVGAEVGAHILQECAKLFDGFVKSPSTSDDVKRPDNVVGLLCSLFLFKVVHCSLLFDVVKALTKRFAEKDIELILIVFRNIGFYLRKEDPKELKECLTDLQRRASEVKTSSSSSEPIGFSKVQFMLDVLLAVKNNNMMKIPNYDAETPERMIKALRTTLSAKKSSKGENSLRVSLEELVDAESKGKWWIVGSAWEGRQAAGGGAPSKTLKESSVDACKVISSTISDAKLAKIEALATTQRMNTELRKTIFAILLTAEDYVDCFQRLLKLNLNEKQEREIVYVLGSACLHEKGFNPYYGHLAAKLIGRDKRFKITFKYWFWDKYRELESMTAKGVSNLAKLLAHLVSRGEVSLDAFKVVEFYRMGEKANLSAFLTTTMTGILVGDDVDDKTLLAPFMEISKSPKLSILRQSLLLFLRHFLAADGGGERDEERLKQIREKIDKVAEFLKKK